MRDAAVAPLRQLGARPSARVRAAVPPGARRGRRRARAPLPRTSPRRSSALAAHGGPFFLGARLTTADVVFAPYVERMNASLFYYKGFALRDARARPRLAAWFAAMEAEPLYRGTMSDFHTHSHDLPPQMGGCYASGDDARERARRVVDLPFAARGVDAADAARGRWARRATPSPRRGRVAIARVARHAESLVARTATRRPTADGALRAALTRRDGGVRAARGHGARAAVRARP